MKKRTLILGIILVVVAVSVAVLAAPMAFFHGGELMEIYRVEYVGPDGNPEKITDDVDLDLLESCLPLIRCRRLRTQFAPYFLEDVEYEISLMDNTNGRTVYIILGEAGLNYIYLSADEGGYKIIDNSAWLNIMELLEVG